MKSHTLFSFGYYGWGNSTRQLVEMMDSVETSRGFQPPLFVDCRIRRSVRAVGFNGAAFERLVAPGRHRWMPQLGNKRIVSRSGPRIQIAEPEAASDLLDLAIQHLADKRRIVFFCGCQFPKLYGAINCHRATVATLIRKAAAKRQVSVETVEWPGGDQTVLDFDVEAAAFRAIAKGALAIPVPREMPLAHGGKIGWCSLARFHSGGDTILRLVGPVQWRRGCWCLPVLHAFSDLNVSLAVAERKAAALRRSWGFEASS